MHRFKNCLNDFIEIKNFNENTKDKLNKHMADYKNM